MRSYRPPNDDRGTRGGSGTASTSAICRLSGGQLVRSNQRRVPLCPVLFHLTSLQRRPSVRSPCPCLPPVSAHYCRSASVPSVKCSRELSQVDRRVRMPRILTDKSRSNQHPSRHLIEQYLHFVSPSSSLPSLELRAGKPTPFYPTRRQITATGT